MRLLKLKACKTLGCIWKKKKFKMKWFSVFSILMVFFLFCSNGNSFLTLSFWQTNFFLFFLIGNFFLFFEVLGGNSL